MKLKARTCQREESLPELSENVERLVRLAYPDAAESMVEVLAKDQFIDALPEENMRLRIRQSSRNTKSCIGDCTGTRIVLVGKQAES